jgi:predicted DNA-binding transcriptional regulator AlpA
MYAQVYYPWFQKIKTESFQNYFDRLIRSLQTIRIFIYLKFNDTGQYTIKDYGFGGSPAYYANKFRGIVELVPKLVDELNKDYVDRLLVSRKLKEIGNSAELLKQDLMDNEYFPTYIVIHKHKPVAKGDFFIQDHVKTFYKEHCHEYLKKYNVFLTRMVNAIELQRELQLSNNTLGRNSNQIYNNVDKLMTRAEVAKYFNACPTTIYNWTKTGKLPNPVKKGRRVYYRSSDIRKMT